MSNKQTRAVATKNKHGLTVDVASQELPLPPPEMLEHYGRILKSSPERLLQQTEKNHQALRETTKQQARWTYHRLYLSFSASIVGLLLTAFMAYQGTHWAAIATTVIGSFGISFFHSFKK